MQVESNDINRKSKFVAKFDNETMTKIQNGRKVFIYDPMRGGVKQYKWKGADR